VSFSNFENIVTAYENRLNESEDLIIENKIRPKLLARLIGTPPAEAYFTIQAIAKCKDIIGDVCEFGVAQGETSALIANEILHSSKVLHLFDSFEGLPKPTDKDRLKDDIFLLGNMEAYTGKMSCPEDMVLARLRALNIPQECFRIHKGFVEKTLLSHNKSNLPDRISLAYVDLDLYEPTKIVLEYIHQIASKGAVIIVDDYEFFSTGVKIAVDEFLDKHNANANSYEYTVPNKKYGYFAVISKN